MRPLRRTLAVFTLTVAAVGAPLAIAGPASAARRPVPWFRR